LRAVEEHAGIDTEVPTDQPDSNDRPDTEAAGTAPLTATAGAGFAIVFNLGRKSTVRMCHSPSQIRRAPALDRVISGEVVPHLYHDYRRHGRDHGELTDADGCGGRNEFSS
jgi:hypothetical protein